MPRRTRIYAKNTNAYVIVVEHHVTVTMTANAKKNVVTTRSISRYEDNMLLMMRTTKT